MSQKETEHATGRLGTLVVANFFVVTGVVALYDTTTYTDLDAKVFPRAAAIVLIVSASIIIVTNLLRPLSEPGFGRGAWWRRALLVTSMLVAAFVMPFTGFLPAAAIAFAGAMVAAMHEQWNQVIAARYIGSGLVIMVGFYALFRFGLNVPLP